MKQIIEQKEQEANKSSKDNKLHKPNRNKLQMNKFHQVVDKKKKKNLQKQLRDTQRLLNKENIDEGLKQAKQEEIKKLEIEIQKKQIQSKRQQRKQLFLEKKYSGVKFVEETKVRRFLQKIEKKIDELQGKNNEQELIEAKKEQKKFKLWLSYIKNFPKDKKYLSLFPKIEEPEMVKKREEIMNEIKEKYDKQQRFLSKIDTENFESNKGYVKKNNQNQEQNIPKVKSKKKEDEFFMAVEENEIQEKSQNQKILKIVDKQGKIIDLSKK